MVVSLEHMSAAREHPQHPSDDPDSELADVAQHRLEADRALSMSQRLARVHELCLQMTQLAGAARRPR